MMEGVQEGVGAELEAAAGDEVAVEKAEREEGRGGEATPELVRVLEDDDGGGGGDGRRREVGAEADPPRPAAAIPAHRTRRRRRLLLLLLLLAL